MRHVTPDELRERTTNFAAEIVKFARRLRRKPEARNIADQMSDSATAVAANYRAVTRARSKREFISKLAVCVEEADETVGWLLSWRRHGRPPSAGKTTASRKPLIY
jgi:four helix bundle protein